MKPRPLLVRELKHLFIICFISMIAGMIYQTLNEGFFDYNAFMLGLLLGLGFYFFNHFVNPRLNKATKTSSFLFKIITKALAYSILIYIISNIGGLIGGSIKGYALADFYKSLYSSSQLYLISYSLILFSTIIFVFHISSLLGKGVLFNLLIGKYHKPVEEERIFMFLDLSSSTEIAEKLGPFEYSSFLKDFFFDIDDAIIETRGAVIQFVGDEVVIIWKVRDGVQNNNCVRIFNLAKTQISDKKDYYKNKYGFIPKFKAGLHYGKIVITAVGGIKQEIAYHGDTINTTARIRSECNNVNKNFLISADILSLLPDIDTEFSIESVGITNLKGKKNVIGLFNVEKKR